MSHWSSFPQIKPFTATNGLTHEPLTACARSQSLVWHRLPLIVPPFAHRWINWQPHCPFRPQMCKQSVVVQPILRHISGEGRLGIPMMRTEPELMKTFLSFPRRSLKFGDNHFFSFSIWGVVFCEIKNIIIIIIFTSDKFKLALTQWIVRASSLVQSQVYRFKLKFFLAVINYFFSKMFLKSVGVNSCQWHQLCQFRRQKLFITMVAGCLWKCSCWLNFTVLL